MKEGLISGTLKLPDPSDLRVRQKSLKVKTDHFALYLGHLG